jgi:hypothetical protein
MTAQGTGELIEALRSVMDELEYLSHEVTLGNGMGKQEGWRYIRYEGEKQSKPLRGWLDRNVGQHRWHYTSEHEIRGRKVKGHWIGFDPRVPESVILLFTLRWLGR